MSSVRAGIASVDFSPEPGLPLMGNFRDDYAARGLHDPLMSKAIVLEDNSGTKAALLAMDVCMLDRENVALIRQTIGSHCDVPPENTLVHATHTHSGPAVTEKLGMCKRIAPHRDRLDHLLRQAAMAVVEANRSLEDVELAVGYAREERVSFCRRLRRKDGTTQMNWEALQPGFDPVEIVGPWDTIDPEAVCVVLRRDDTPVAAIINFGLHPAILAGDNWLYSADYPGYLAEALARTFGSAFTSLFLNGCCGDVNHVDYRVPAQGRGFQMAQRVGYMLAVTAHQAIRNAQPAAADRVRVTRERVPLQRLQISSSQQRWCHELLTEVKKHPPVGQVDGLPDAHFADLLLDMARYQAEPDNVEVMVVRVGDIAIAGLPGEVFCQLGRNIKQRSPVRHTLVAGLCNDAIGYLPTRGAFQQGGYETTTGSTFYVPGSAEQIVASAIKQLEESEMSHDQTSNAP